MRGKYSPGFGKLQFIGAKWHTTDGVQQAVRNLCDSEEPIRGKDRVNKCRFGMIQNCATLGQPLLPQSIQSTFWFPTLCIVRKIEWLIDWGYNFQDLALCMPYTGIFVSYYLYYLFHDYEDSVQLVLHSIPTSWKNASPTAGSQCIFLIWMNQ